MTFPGGIAYLARPAISSRLQHYQPTRKGDLEAPLDDRELEAKYVELALPVIGDAPARALLQRLWRLEREAEVTLAA